MVVLPTQDERDKGLGCEVSLSRVVACHYPADPFVWLGKGVVTGAEIGLQARRGKQFAKNFLRAVFVTRCYCRRIHWLREQRCRLKPTWAPQGATVPHRCNGDVRADAPQGTVGYIDSDGGLIQLNGQVAAGRVLFETVLGPGRFPEYRGGPAVARGRRRRRGRHLPRRAGEPQPPGQASRRNRARGQGWKTRHSRRIEPWSNYS